MIKNWMRFVRRAGGAAALAAVGCGLAAGTARADEGSSSKQPPYADVLKEAKTFAGAIKLHRKGGKLLAEIAPAQLNKDFLVLVSIARGIGEGSLLGGMSWGFGDDWLWQFRKVDDALHLVRINTRFQANAGSPESKAVRLAYSDSILFNLPIVTTAPSGAYVVDLSPVFLGDLPQLQQAMPGLQFSPDRSTWGSVKAFPENCELDVQATYAYRGPMDLETVPDSRGVTMTIHYSISQIPNDGYKPRLADDRVGYFLTAVKDYSTKTDQDRFVRYINRWDLQKADPSADLSPPKKPIVFWLEKTVPFGYRKAIREGILEWNKAFEKAGFANAIEVRQQEEGDDWDPEDVRYNTFRWITSSAGFAMGPSRVNPRTGQILDADIIFDADFVQFWKHEYETFTPESVAAMTGGPLDLKGYRAEKLAQRNAHRSLSQCTCGLAHGMGHELAFGASALWAQHDAGLAKPLEEKLILQGLKEVTMHEVGHTLGLRHNFKASTMLSLKDMNDADKTKETGLVASVMDYTPANIVSKDDKQGDFYTQTIGAYDYWAIEYGYKPFSGGTEGETAELKKIAARCATPELDYSTDEDTRGIDSDPLSNRFDLGKDPLEYAEKQAKLVSSLYGDVVKKVVKDGDGYQRARQAFAILLGTYGRSMFFAARNVGGIYVHRDHKADPNGRTPFELVPTDKQRAALKLIEEKVLSDKPFQFPPELYNQLASSRWSHWGVHESVRLDFPVHDAILMWQTRILSQLLSPLTLERLHDAELKQASDKDVLTTAELLDRLTNAVFSEVDELKAGEYSTRKPAVSSLRRNLQRAYVRQLGELALGSTGAPEDCQTVAYLKLIELQRKLKDKSTKGDLKLDVYTAAHLQETAERIGKIVEARIVLSRP